jgi:hypothetical protein
MMSSELYRKYIDIINENSQQPKVLTEGMLDKIGAMVKSKVIPQVERMLGGKLEAVKQAALKATGGDTSLSLDNIKKVGAALKNMGLDKAVAESVQLNEGFFDKAALAAATGLTTSLLLGWSAPFILLTIAVLLMVA